MQGGAMADECNKKKEEFKPTVDKKKYDSDPFDEGDSWDKGQAIKSFLKKILPPDTKICEESCSGGNETCLPKSITITVPTGKGSFKKAHLETEEDESVFIYYLKIKEKCKITVNIKCRCVPFPD
jgi:hypothetical protein